MQGNKILNTVLGLVKEIDGTIDKGLPEKLAQIVKIHAKGSAISSFVCGWIPGIGGLTSVIITSAFVWSMYARINTEVKLPTTQHLLKSILSGLGANIVVAVTASIISTALSFIPVFGSLASSVIQAIIGYTLVLASGLLYLKIMTNIFKAAKDPSSMSVADIKQLAKAVTNHKDIQPLINETKTKYLPSNNETISGVIELAKAATNRYNNHTPIDEAPEPGADCRNDDVVKVVDDARSERGAGLLKKPIGKNSLI